MSDVSNIKSQNINWSNSKAVASGKVSSFGFLSDNSNIPGFGNNKSTTGSNQTSNKNDKLEISAFGTGKSKGKDGLTDEERSKVEELKKTDKKVRAHETAHMSAGGSLVKGAANYTYTTGPDGKQYATGGEVSIDISSDPKNPEKTIQKMQQVIKAALAPSDPSGQDRSVASKASQIIAQTKSEIQKSNGTIGDKASSFTSNIIKKYTSDQSGTYQTSQQNSNENAGASNNSINFYS